MQALKSHPTTAAVAEKTPDPDDPTATIERFYVLLGGRKNNMKKKCFNYCMLVFGMSYVKIAKSCKILDVLRLKLHKR